MTDYLHYTKVVKSVKIPEKHAEIGDPSRSLPLRAVVQAPVSILEVSRSAPRLNDQKPYRRLNSSSC